MQDFASRTVAVSFISWISGSDVADFHPYQIQVLLKSAPNVTICDETNKYVGCIHYDDQSTPAPGNAVQHFDH